MMKSGPYVPSSEEAPEKNEHSDLEINCPDPDSALSQNLGDMKLSSSSKRRKSVRYSQPPEAVQALNIVKYSASDKQDPDNQTDHNQTTNPVTIPSLQKSASAVEKGTRRGSIVQRIGLVSSSRTPHSDVLPTRPSTAPARHRAMSVDKIRSEDRLQSKSCENSTSSQLTFFSDNLDEIYKTDNVKAFIVYLTTTNLNVDAKWQGKPFLHHALLHKAAAIFDYLIKNNADLNALSEDNKGLIDYVREDNVRKPASLAFLAASQERLQKLFAKHESVASIQLKTEKKFDQILIKCGILAESSRVGYNSLFSPSELICLYKNTSDSALNQKWAAIFDGNEANRELYLFLYTLCSGLSINTTHSSNEIVSLKTFDFKTARCVILGLLSLYPAEKIILPLTKLYPFFGKSQKLIVYFLLKEIFCQDYFQHCYQSGVLKRFFQESFFPLSQQDSNLKAKKLNTKLLDIMLLMQQRMIPLQLACHRLGLLIARCRPTENTGSFLNLKSEEFAKELRAITLLSWQALGLNEFQKLAWSSPEAKQFSPTIVYQTMLANKISQYIAFWILRTKNCHARAQIITNCIRAISFLLEDKKQPDVQSANVLLSALSLASIARLEKTFAALDSNIRSQLEGLHRRLDIVPNYKSQREIMENPATPAALPNLPIYLRDLTFASDNSGLSAKAMMLGKIFVAINSHLKTLSNLEEPILRSDFLLIIDQFQLLDEKVLDNYSLEVELKPISLHPQLTFEKLFQLLTLYVKKQDTLQVIWCKEIYTGDNAARALFQFIKSQYSCQINGEEFKDPVKLMDIFNLLVQIEQISSVAEECRLQAVQLVASRLYLPSGSYLPLPSVPSSEVQSPTASPMQSNRRDEKEKNGLLSL